MRVVLQRVSRAAVRIDGKTVGAIGVGLLLLAGFHRSDTEDTLGWMADKVLGLRVFSDPEGKMNLALADVPPGGGGGVLVVSQFTLYGDVQKGRRPSFIDAAPPEIAIPLYERFVALLRERLLKSALGRLERERGRLDEVAGRIAQRQADPYALAEELANQLGGEA